MEYERALFRVYDKSMEGLRSPSVRTACWYAQKGLMILSAGLFATLWLLHSRFVDQPGCIAMLIEDAADREGLLVKPGKVAPLWVSVDGTQAPPDAGAISAANSSISNGSFIANGSLDNGTAEDDDDEDTQIVLLPSGASIPYDVMIGISIGGGIDIGADGADGNGDDGERKSRSGKTWGLRGSKNGKRGGEGRMRRVEEVGEDGEGGEEGNDGEGEGNSTATNGTSFPADYTFAFEPMVALLPDRIRGDHDFQWVNFTLQPNECFSGAGVPARFLASRVIGYDIMMVNMFMMSSNSKGLLTNTETGAQWFWPKSSTASTGWLARFFDAFWFKVDVLIRSVIAFVLMSTVTAMTVRTLLSSGVVIMFPLVLLLERLGLTIPGMHQTLAMSYPWLGMPIEHLRHRNKPVGPFIMGHIMQMVVFYSVYNACLLAWSAWLYGKPTTTTLQVWLYGMVMLWEYFALIFVRSRSSIVFFSRAAALSFLAFHFYFYHFRAGYFGLAAWACFSAMFAAKLYVLQALELPAYMSGEVSHDEPRAHFVELPWSTWDAALPPMWSLFIPPNTSTTGVYGDTVPDRPGTGGDDNEDGNVNANADVEAGEAGDGDMETPGSAAFVPVGLGVNAVGVSRERRGEGRARLQGRGRRGGGGLGDATGGHGDRGRGGRRNRSGSGEGGVEMATRRRRASSGGNGIGSVGRDIEEL